MRRRWQKFRRECPCNRFCSCQADGTDTGCAFAVAYGTQRRRKTSGCWSRPTFRTDAKSVVNSENIFQFVFCSVQTVFQTLQFPFQSPVFVPGQRSVPVQIFQFIFMKVQIIVNLFFFLPLLLNYLLLLPQVLPSYSQFPTIHLFRAPLLHIASFLPFTSLELPSHVLSLLSWFLRLPQVIDSHLRI